jgi:hypothetical protein
LEQSIKTSSKTVIAAMLRSCFLRAKPQEVKTEELEKARNMFIFDVSFRHIIKGLNVLQSDVFDKHHG